MTDIWPGTAYRYFSMDSADDISGSALTLGLSADALTVTAEYVASPKPALLAEQPPPATGLTRFWWRHLCGTGTDLPLTYGRNTVHGQLADNPETLPTSWVFQIGWE